MCKVCNIEETEALYDGDKGKVTINRGSPTSRPVLDIRAYTGSAAWVLFPSIEIAFCPECGRALAGTTAEERL